jgi:multidrug efflux system membrane fusion protein
MRAFIAKLGAALRPLVSYGVAGLIVLVAGAWLATGTLVIGGRGPGNGERPLVSLIDKDAKMAEVHHDDERPDPHLTIAERVAETSGASAPSVSVRTVTYTMRAMEIEVPLRGRTQAKASVSVVPQTQGNVQSVLVEKGQTVAEGDILCKLDPGDREAAVAQAQAALDQAQSAYDANASLRAKELAAANSGLQLEAALKGAQAALDNAKTELGRTDVKATVAGVVQDPLASVGSMAGPQAPCATIVQLDPMLFKSQVPEARIAYAKLGLPATVETVTGQKVEGKVSYIASTADEATRSFAVEIEIPNKDGKVLDGITASAIVKVGTAPAHLLPQSVLTLDDDGVLGIRAVEDSKVAFFPITIIKDDREGVWVTGLPPKVDVITLGQEFVQAGQTVNATNVSAADAAAEDAKALETKPTEATTTEGVQS